MTRYCILSIPRTGSTWIINSIGRCYSGLKNYISLDEFFTPFVNDRARFNVDKNNIIYSTIENQSIEISNISNFINERLDILLKGDKHQPLILKYMYWPHGMTEILDLENLQKIKDHNITIININRNPFESTISLLVAKLTGVSHRWNTSTGSWYTTNTGNKKEIVEPKVSIAPLDFEALYVQFLIAYKNKQNMVDKLGCTTLNYSSMHLDCMYNKIPIDIVPHAKKLYDIPYSVIIQNYEELLDLKQKIDATS